MNKKATAVLAGLHTNDVLNLSILARHHDLPKEDRDRIIESIRCNATRRIARALVTPQASYCLRSWVIQNVFSH